MRFCTMRISKETADDLEAIHGTYRFRFIHKGDFEEDSILMSPTLPEEGYNGRMNFAISKDTITEVSLNDITNISWVYVDRGAVGPLNHGVHELFVIRFLKFSIHWTQAV